MPSAIYFRIVGQLIGLTVHSVNSLVMFISMLDRELMRDPDIKTMTDLQSRYLTVWNIFLQMLYFSLALLCDGATVTKKDHLLPRKLKNFRYTLFAVFLIPTTLIVVELFWPFFLYDRSLIFPAFIDKIFSFKSNLVIHLAILPLALWELVFLPRLTPRSHTKNLWTFVVYGSLYNAFIVYTHGTTGHFPYPILHITYGTVLFPLLLIGVVILGIINYLLQWKITASIWGKEETSRADIGRIAPNPSNAIN